MKGANASDVVMNLLSMPPPLDAGHLAPHAIGYEARRKRTEWPEGVRMDDEVKALDERNGKWILCRTCAEHYEKYAHAPPLALLQATSPTGWL